MNPPLLHAELDYVQVAIIVLAVIFSFVKWLWEQWTGSKSQIPDYDEVAGQPEEPRRTPSAPAVPPPIPATPPTVAAAPWEEFLKAMREISDKAPNQKPPRAPAQGGAYRRPESPRKHVEKAPPPAPVVSLPVVAPATPPAVVETRAPTAMMTALRALRDDPAALRRAIVLGEVLGPPKAFN